MTPSPTVHATTFLSRFPNHEHAIAVEEVTADLSSERFHQHFVLRHRPCVIRGAVAHWPAVHEWDADVLRAKVGSTLLGANSAGVLYEPIVEFGPSRIFATPNRMTFAQFLNEVESGDAPRVQVYAERLSVLEPLAADVADLGFLDVAACPPRSYPDRFFFSRRGYTDWHTHQGDETVTAQLLGSKEFLLLPPDRTTFAAMMPMARRGVWKTPSPCWPEDFGRLVPHRVVLHAGDAVYIPMHWWHAVEAVADELNATFARVFGTPMRWMSDVRLANVRLSLKGSLTIAVVDSVRSMRPRHVRALARSAGITAAGVPAALWYNRGPNDLS